MNGCVAVKDMLLDILRDAEPDTLLESIETVLTYLERSKGFFADCEYEYKGAEIAAICRNSLTSRLPDTRNHKRVERINRVKQRAAKLEQELYRMKVDRMTAEREAYDRLQEQLPSWEYLLA